MTDRFGKVLRLRRRAAGLTLGQLAAHINVTVSYLSDVERGRRYPFRLEVIDTISRIIECDSFELIDAAVSERGRIDISTSSQRAFRIIVALAQGWVPSTSTMAALEHELGIVDNSDRSTRKALTAARTAKKIGARK